MFFSFTLITFKSARISYEENTPQTLISVKSLLVLNTQGCYLLFPLTMKSQRVISCLLKEEVYLCHLHLKRHYVLCVSIIIFVSKRNTRAPCPDYFHAEISSTWSKPHRNFHICQESPSDAFEALLVLGAGASSEVLGAGPEEPLCGGPSEPPSSPWSF